MFIPWQTRRCTDVLPVLQDLFNSGKTSGSSTSVNTPQNSLLYQRGADA